MARSTTEMASKYRVVRLSREELKMQCKDDDFEQWGAPQLDLAQYQLKEKLKRGKPFSQRGSIFWVLVDNDGKSDDPCDDSALVPGKSELYCHCQSHRFDCVLRHPSGKLERGFSHHLGSVYTLPAYRKRGLASFFLKEVARQLAELPGAVASALYSAIGPTYYDRLGWRVHPVKMITLEVGHPRNAPSSDGFSQKKLAALFPDTALDELLKSDSERRVQELTNAKFDGREVFMTMPSRDSIEWHFGIGVHYARVGGLEELPARCGIKAREDAFVLWWDNFKESRLYILRACLPEVVAGAEDDAIAITCQLLCGALEEARKFGLKHVIIWDPPAVLLHEGVRNQFEVVEAEHTDSLSSLRLFKHDGVKGEATAAELPLWVGNEKGVWV